MKRYAVAVLLTLSLFASGVPVANAAVNPGSKCSKAGMEKIDKGKVYTCIQSGNKLVWNKGSNVLGYSAFAETLLSEAKKKAAQIISEAESSAFQISNPPNCTTGGSRAVASMGTDQFGLSALVFENSGICELVVRASATFICPDGGTSKTNNSIISSGSFSLKAGEKLFVSVNVAYYFPQVLTDCRLLTGYAATVVSLNPFQYPPSVIVLSSRYTGVFNQVEAIKKANQLIKNAKTRAKEVIAEAENPVSVAKAWDVGAEARAAVEALTPGRGKVCKSGLNCLIGSTGPGGGIIFFDAGSQKPWGRYLEMAPNGWSGVAADPRLSWCNIDIKLTLYQNISDETLKSAHGVEIGKGKANTKLMLAFCSAGAGVLAQSYRGGGKSDWYLPSIDELNEICKYARYQATGKSEVRCDQGEKIRAGFETKESYWSSSEDINGAWMQQFLFQSYLDAVRKDNKYHIRPIRAF